MDKSVQIGRVFQSHRLIPEKGVPVVLETEVCVQRGHAFSRTQKTPRGPMELGRHLPGPSPGPPLRHPHPRRLLSVGWRPSGARAVVAGGPGVAAVPAGVTGTPASRPAGVPLQDWGALSLLWGAAARPGCLRACLQPEGPPDITGVPRGASCCPLWTSSLSRLLPGTTRLSPRPLRGHRRRILGTRPSPGSCAFPPPLCCSL